MAEDLPAAMPPTPVLRPLSGSLEPILDFLSLDDEPLLLVPYCLTQQAHAAIMSVILCTAGYDHTIRSVKSLLCQIPSQN